MTTSENLKKLNIELPDPPDPVGAYVAFKKTGKLIFISGQLPIRKDGKIIKGKIGKELSLQEGQQAAKLCALNILAQAKKAVSDDFVSEWKREVLNNPYLNLNNWFDVFSEENKTGKTGYIYAQESENLKQTRSHSVLLFCSMPKKTQTPKRS